MDIIYPRRCPICDKVLAYNNGLICDRCKKNLVMVKTPFCKKCGKALEDERIEYCRDCTTTKHFYEEGRALFLYPCIRRSLYRYKYKGRKEYALFYGRMMVAAWGDVIKSWDPDALVPVPLHKNRLKKRGYNQSELLCKVMTKYLKIPTMTDLVERSKNTVPQKALDATQRQNNLKNAFKIGINDVELKTIVIVDDIYTTGATIDHIAKLLKTFGVEKVYYVSLAIGR